MAEHCWHSSGAAKTAYPPIEQLQCCWCGQNGTRQMVETTEPAVGHGPYGPRRRRAVINPQSLCPNAPNPLPTPEEKTDEPNPESSR